MTRAGHEKAPPAATALRALGETVDLIWSIAKEELAWGPVDSQELEDFNDENRSCKLKRRC